MRRLVLAIVAATLCTAGPAAAEVKLHDELDLGRYNALGAVGLYATGRDNPSGQGLSLRLLGLDGSKVTPLPPRPGVPGLGSFRIRFGAAGPPFTHLQPPRAGESAPGRYPIAVVGEQFRGVLTSDSTRIAGLVTLDDLFDGRLEWRADKDAVATVERLERRIERNDELRLPLTVLLGVVTVALALLRPRLAPRAVLLALALNLWLSPPLALAAALAAVALPLGPACAALVAVYFAALGLDAETVALSPLGPSQLSRFYGLSNLLATLFLLPALLGAALLGRKRGALLAVLALVTVGGSRFGADGGGLLVLLVGYGVLAVRLSGERLTRRRVAMLCAAAVLAGLALVGLDALTGGSSHVTDAIGDGPIELAGDLADRVERSVDRTLDSDGAILVVVVGFAVLVWIAATRRGDPVLDALLAALAVSLIVNDTPSDVVGAGAVVAVTLVRLQAAASARPAEPEPEPEPDPAAAT